MFYEHTFPYAISEGNPVASPPENTFHDVQAPMEGENYDIEREHANNQESHIMELLDREERTNEP